MVQIKCDINIGKKAFVLIILGFVLIIAAGFVISKGEDDRFNNPLDAWPDAINIRNPGHLASDIVVWIEGELMSLADAYEDYYLLTMDGEGGIADVHGSMDVDDWIGVGYWSLWKTCPCDVNGNNCPDECVVECPDGKRILGGGCSINSGTGQILENFPLDNYHWKCIGDNVGMTAHAICAKMTHSVLAETF